jgi:hypothetical protein
MDELDESHARKIPLRITPDDSLPDVILRFHFMDCEEWSPFGATQPGCVAILRRESSEGRRGPRTPWVT